MLNCRTCKGDAYRVSRAVICYTCEYHESVCKCRGASMQKLIEQYSVIFRSVAVGEFTDERVQALLKEFRDKVLKKRDELAKAEMTKAFGFDAKMDWSDE
jgi:hypothetical protein